MSTNVKYKGSTIAVLGEGAEATLHTENTILTGDIQVEVEKGTGASVSSTLPWGNITNIPSYLMNEANLRAFIAANEQNANIPSWAKTPNPPKCSYDDLEGNFPGVKEEELSQIVIDLINSSIDSVLVEKVGSEVTKQLANITYNDIKDEGFPGVKEETDPCIPAWAKKESPDYNDIPNRLVIGEEAGKAYDWAQGQENRNRIGQAPQSPRPETLHPPRCST